MKTEILEVAITKVLAQWLQSHAKGIDPDQLTAISFNLAAQDELVLIDADDTITLEYEVQEEEAPVKAEVVIPEPGTTPTPSAPAPRQAIRVGECVFCHQAEHAPTCSYYEW